MPRAACREGEELAILETVRDKVPPEVFTKPYTNPVGGTPEAVRANLREAMRLLREAGYEIRNRKLVNAKTGEPLTVEFLLDRARIRSASSLPYKPSLERLGITVTRAHRRRRAIREPAAAMGLRHHHRGLGPVAVARQRAARLSGARRPPTSRARATSSASRIRRSMR